MGADTLLKGGEPLVAAITAAESQTDTLPIFRAMRQNGSPEPIFESDENRT